MKFIQILCVMLIAFTAVSYASHAAYFVMGDIRDEFVIKLTDPAKIQHARDLISGATTEQKHVMGIIVKTPVWYNWEWSYYLEPSSISFWDMAMEVCDAEIRYTEDHLSEVGGELLPGNRWCPWTSYIKREI